MMALNLYDLLGINKNATTREIKKAFYSLSLIHHPDRSSEDKKTATRKFQQLEEAHRLLSNETIRKAYDLEGLESARALHIEFMQDNLEHVEEPDSQQQSPEPSETSHHEEVEINVEEDTYETTENSEANTSNPNCTNSEQSESSNIGHDQEMGTESDDEVIIIYERINCPESEMNVADSSECTTSTGSENSDEESLASDISLKSSEWLVDSIIDEKFENGVIKYLVKWIGFEETTWEPKANLTGCKLALRKFKRKKRKRMMQERQ